MASGPDCIIMLKIPTGHCETHDRMAGQSDTGTLASLSASGSSPLC